MTSLEPCVGNSGNMTTLTNSLEVFDTYKHREDKDSDEESFHLPLDDDESESKIQESLKNGANETEDDILNKFASANGPLEHIDSRMEERLLNEEQDHTSNNLSNGHSASFSEDSKTSAESRTSIDEKDNVEKSSNSALNKDSSENLDSNESNVNNEVLEGDLTASESASVEQKCAISCVKDEDGGTTEKSIGESPMEIDDNAECGSLVNKTEKSEPGKVLEKCENSNDSTKHQNEDSEDLFDISIIRDAEEDNAERALTEEDHVEENEEEEERHDKAEEETTHDKVNNTEDEEDTAELEKQEQLKNDDLDIEESNFNCVGDKELVGGEESDSSGKTIVSDNKSQVRDIDKPTTNTAEQVSHAVSEENTDDSSSGTKEPTSDNDDLNKRKSLKRPLPGEPDSSVAKKNRTDDDSAKDDKQEAEKPREKLPLTTLLTLGNFMKSKKFTRKLTIHDLEEFCLQKICEVVVHKSELGDVHHQLKQQEQLIETMRKEIQQLTKQARDLEIVNKKLMNDLKQQTTTQKPLNPLKITRSVGLQVKFTPVLENVKRRHPSTVSSQKVPVQSTASRGPRAGITNSSVVGINRQVNSPQKQQQPVSKPTTPILSQALQNRRSVSTDNNTNKNAQQPPRSRADSTKSGAPSASVIDLTDEDDKREKNKNVATKVQVVPQKNIAVPLRTTTPVRMTTNSTQGIRLATSQGKPTSLASVVTSSAPQVMYVVQSSTSQNVLASSLGAKTVVVNFQPTNGVLTSALNGSAVSVIPKQQTNTIQLKTVATTKTIPSNKVVKSPNKHPAPLPAPPVVRINVDKSLKPIPPKPHLTIRKTETGIILQWKMPYELDLYEVIASYQLYAYQETSALPSTDMWRKVGDVKALALPMACTLTQFADKNKYYFAVRPVDIHKRIGVFSEPEEISL